MRQSVFSHLNGVVLAFLLIELVDELVYGAHETAWPLIRNDLGLSYTQIGLALSLPGLFGNLVEPVMGVLGDTGRRRGLILGGGLFFSAALLWISQAQGFVALLLASCLFNPSSGAFVGLSQASLMDAQPARREQNMARWTFAGSLGVTLGPLALSAAAWLGWGWRGLFAVLAGLSLLTLAAAAGLLSRDSGKVRAVKTQIDATNVDGEPEDTEGEKTRVDAEEVLGNAERGEDRPLTFRESLRGALAGLRRGEVLRWLALLEFSDLMLDVLYAYLALYLVDVVGVSVENAGLGVAVWTGVGLLGDFLLIPLLERVKGLTYLRVSVLVEMTLYPMFLLLQPFPAKVAVLGLLGFFNAGWYAVLSGQLFDAMPGRSGAVLTLKNVAGWFGTLIPLGVGLAAQYLGLSNAMWLLLAGPLALLVGLPRRDLAARNSA